MRRDLVWNVYDYSATARRQREISAHNIDAHYQQQNWAIGDPGTETGHTVGSEGVDPITINNDGLGDVDKFIRFVVHQNDNQADNLRTQSFRAQYFIDSWIDIATSGGTEPVLLVDHASLTNGNATTNRMTNPSSSSFLSTNGGQIDTGDSGTTTFTQNAESHMEVLVSIRLVDANLSDGDDVSIRLVFGAGGDTAAGTELDTYAVIGNPTISWRAAAGGTAVKDIIGRGVVPFSR